MELKEAIEERLKEQDSTFSKANCGELYEAVASAIRPLIGNSDCVRKSYPFALIGLEISVSNILSYNLNGLGLTEKLKDILSERAITLSEILKHEETPPLGVGEIGKLCYDFLRSANYMGFPAIGYGIKYKRGYFKQKFTTEQIELNEKWRTKDHPSFFVRKNRSFSVDVSDEHNDSIGIIPTDMPLIGPGGKSSLIRFFEASYDRALNTDAEYLTRIYPSELTDDGKIRKMIDNYLLVEASLKDLEKRNSTLANTKIMVTDQELFIVVPLLIEHLMKEGYSLETAAQTARENLLFLTDTTYSIWQKSADLSLVSMYFPKCANIISKLSGEGESKSLAQARFLIKNSSQTLGLSRSYIDEIIRTTFSDISPEKFRTAELGADLRRVISQGNPLLDDYLEKRGIDYRKDSKELMKLSKRDSEIIREIKVMNKEKLSSIIAEKYGVRVNPSAVFIGHLGGFYEYRREIITLLEIIRRYIALVENPNRETVPLVFIMEGLANPDYEMARRTVKLCLELSKIVNEDLRTKGKLKFILWENMSIAECTQVNRSLDISLSTGVPNNAAFGLMRVEAAANGARVISSYGGVYSDKFDYFGPKAYTCEYKPSFDALREDEKNAVYALIDGTVFERAKFDKEFESICVHGDYFKILRDFPLFRRSFDKLIREFSDDILWNEKAVEMIRSASEFSADREIIHLGENLRHDGTQN